MKPPGLKHNHPRDGTRSYSLLPSDLKYSLGVATGECYSPLSSTTKRHHHVGKETRKTYLLWTATDPPRHQGNTRQPQATSQLAPTATIIDVYCPRQFIRNRLRCPNRWPTAEIIVHTSTAPIRYLRSEAQLVLKCRVHVKL